MKHNAANERIKREYFDYLKEAKGRDEATIDVVAKFEQSTGAKDFKRLHREQAKTFMRSLKARTNPHCFRDMLVHHAMALDLSPEAMKAWSQNLRHGAY